jgi:hypothetical protein
MSDIFLLRLEIGEFLFMIEMQLFVFLLINCSPLHLVMVYFSTSCRGIFCYSLDANAMSKVASSPIAVINAFFFEEIDFDFSFGNNLWGLKLAFELMDNAA